MANLLKPGDDGWAPPSLDFKLVAARVRQRWDSNAPHHVVVSQTRGGKSYLVGRGLLPQLRKDSRLLIVDSKGDDQTLSYVPALPTDRIPHRLRRGSRRDYNQWYRLICAVGRDNRAAMQARVERALDVVMREGDWVVYFDEGRSMVGTQHPDLGLGATYGHVVRLGGYKGVRAITATQTPSWMPREAYSQASFAWLGKIEDEASIERVGEIGGSRRLLRTHLPHVRKTHWLYTDAEEDDRMYVMTRVGGTAHAAA